MKNKTVILIAIILLAAASRLIPHPNNFAPLGAMALFGGYYFSKKWQAFLITVGSWWLADLFLNNVVFSAWFPSFTWISQSFITVAIALFVIILISKIVIKNADIQSVALASVLSSIAFFLITNFGTFLQYYPKNSTGLMAAYIAGIPFFTNTLMGDLVYSSLMFGSFYLVKNKLKMNLA
jgi:hypothetical protein